MSKGIKFMSTFKEPEPEEMKANGSPAATMPEEHPVETPVVASNQNYLENLIREL